MSRYFAVSHRGQMTCYFVTQLLNCPTSWTEHLAMLVMSWYVQNSSTCSLWHLLQFRILSIQHVIPMILMRTLTVEFRCGGAPTPLGHGHWLWNKGCDCARRSRTLAKLFQQTRSAAVLFGSPLDVPAGVDF